MIGHLDSSDSIIFGPANRENSIWFLICSIRSASLWFAEQIDDRFVRFAWFALFAVELDLICSIQFARFASIRTQVFPIHTCLSIIQWYPGIQTSNTQVNWISVHQKSGYWVFGNQSKLSGCQIILKNWDIECPVIKSLLLLVLNTSKSGHFYFRILKQPSYWSIR